MSSKLVSYGVPKLSNSLHVHLAHGTTTLSLSAASETPAQGHLGAFGEVVTIAEPWSAYPLNAAFIVECPCGWCHPGQVALGCVRKENEMATGN